MLEYFDIGFRAVNGINILEDIKSGKDYNRHVLEDVSIIAENSKDALEVEEYKDYLQHYYRIFWFPLLDMKNWERIANERKMADKTVNLFRKLKPSESFSEEEFCIAKNFLEIISERCLLLQNKEFQTQ